MYTEIEEYMQKYDGLLSLSFRMYQIVNLLGG